jgi:hypothetical protein
MSDKKSHPIRNGIIVTVIGGIILAIILSFKNEFLKLLGWIWSGFVWVWNAIWASHSLPGWILIILFSLAFVGAFVGIKKIYLAFRSDKKSVDIFDALNKIYTKDFIFDAKWSWSWENKTISHLWCDCPHCDIMLIYEYDDLKNKINFICEHCNRKVVATIEGGNIDYALGAVKREILRRIKTGEFKKHVQTHEVSE